MARSTFASEKAKNIARCGAKQISKSTCTKHRTFGPLLKVECGKSGRRCGVKQISKSKCTKHTMLGALLEIEMSKKCTPLWREVKMYKAPQVRTPFKEVAMSKKWTPLWREAHFEVKMLKTPGPRTTFGRSDVLSRGRCKGLWTLSKVSKT